MSPAWLLLHVLAILVVVVAVAIQGSTGRPTHVPGSGWVLEAFFASLAFRPLIVALHETAHASVAAGLGHRPRIVVLFKGNHLLTFEFFGVAVAISRSLFSGGIAIHEVSNCSSWRFRRVAIVAAGPAANVVLGGVTFWLLGKANGASSWIVAGLTCCTLTMGLESMVPSTNTSVLGSRIDSDGRAMVKLLRATRMDDASVAAANAALDLRARALVKDPTWLADFQIQFPQASATITLKYGDLYRAGLLEEARQLLVDRLANDVPLSRAERANFHNTIAWTDLISEDPERLAGADGHCQQAIDLDPQPMYIDTTGWLLLMQGHAQLAHEWLSRAHQSPDRQTRSSAATGLSYAAAILGDAELSEAWQRTADRLANGETLRLPVVRVVPQVAGNHVRTQLDKDALAGVLGP
jgi:hypothetical protein